MNFQWIATFAPRGDDMAARSNIGYATDIRDALAKFEAAHPGEVITKIARYDREQSERR